MEVEFHTGVADPLDFACRLLRKACRQGVRVLVTAPPPLLAALDTRLWAVGDSEFLPHVKMPGAAPAVAGRTPIWLCDGADGSAAQRKVDGTGAPEETNGAAAPQDAGGAGTPRVWLNVGAAAPTTGSDATAASRIDRLIEVVSTDPDDAVRGRERWRDYKQRGWSIKHHPAAVAPD